MVMGDPPRYDNPKLVIVAGVVVLFYGLLSYLGGGSWASALVGGVGEILLGVAEHLPARMRWLAVALRVSFLLSLVVMALVLVAQVLP